MVSLKEMLYRRRELWETREYFWDVIKDSSNLIVRLVTTNQRYDYNMNMFERTGEWKHATKARDSIEKALGALEKYSLGMKPQDLGEIRREWKQKRLNLIKKIEDSNLQIY